MSDISQDLVDKGMASISNNLDRMVKTEKIAAADKDQILSQ